SRDCTLVARRLLPVRAGRGARTRRIVTRRGGLCGGRHEGARGPTRALDRRDQADRADEMTCPPSSSVLSSSSCCCLPLTRFPKLIPRKRCGCCGTLAAARRCCSPRSYSFAVQSCRQFRLG